MKLGLLVAASVVASAVLTWYGLVVLGWYPRYSLPVAVVVALAITQLLARGMTAPLRQMTAAARAMAEGRPVPPVRATSRDEVGELARAFTAMASDLATADEQRRELLANVSHELRTPVAALRAQMENLVDGVRPGDQAALGEVLGQVERLASLLDDLLDLARVESGARSLERVPVRLEPLIAGIVAEAATVRPDRRIAVEVDPPDLVADADPRRVAQMLGNLVDNATRHARPGGQVLVSARRGDAGELVLEVTDDGPGIPPERREAVFERFRRGATGEIALTGAPTAGGAGQDGGTGLGLAIARWAVVLHGGRIAVVDTEGGLPDPGGAAGQRAMTTR